MCANVPALPHHDGGARLEHPRPAQQNCLCETNIMTDTNASRTDTEIILLASGASNRMKGRDKLIEKIDEIPLLYRSAQHAVASNIGRVSVILRPDDSARRNALGSLAVRIVENADWSEGMASAIRTGIANLAPDCNAVLIALADMPDIYPHDYNTLHEALNVENHITIARAATTQGKPGHPVLFAQD